MGSDDLFKKRKVRKARDISRRIAKRSENKKILIVCEGQKTEPLYFTALKNDYRLHATEIRIISAKRSDPMSLIDTAKQNYSDSIEEGDPYDSVFCVFDKDEHAHYNDAVKTIAKLEPKSVYYAITSVPCFEFWLLLHYCYTTRQFESKKNKSAAEQVVCELKKHISKYEKGDPNIYEKTKESIDKAIINAKKVNEFSKNNGTDDPSTQVCYLVEQLIEASNNKKTEKIKQ